MEQFAGPDSHFGRHRRAYFSSPRHFGDLLGNLSPMNGSFLAHALSMNIRRTHENPLKINRRLGESTLEFYIPPFRFEFRISGPVSKRGRRAILTIVFKKLREVLNDFREVEIYHSQLQFPYGLFDPRPVSLRQTPNLETKLGRAGYALRLRRHKSYLTLRELSELSGVDLHHISAIERGRHCPRKDTVQRLDLALTRYEEEGIICLSPSRTSNPQRIPKMTSSPKREQRTPAASTPGKTGVRKLDGLAEMWAAQQQRSALSLTASNIDSES